MLTLNFLPEIKDSPNFVTMIFGEIIVVEMTWGVLDKIPCTLTKDDALNSKSFEIMNFMTE